MKEVVGNFQHTHLIQIEIYEIMNLLKFIKTLQFFLYFIKKISEVTFF